MAVWMAPFISPKQLITERRQCEAERGCGFQQLARASERYGVLS